MSSGRFTTSCIAITETANSFPPIWNVPKISESFDGSSPLVVAQRGRYITLRNAGPQVAISEAIISLQSSEWI